MTGCGQRPVTSKVSELKELRKAAQNVLDAYQKMLNDDDLEILRDALTELKELLP